MCVCRHNRIVSWVARIIATLVVSLSQIMTSAQNTKQDIPSFEIIARVVRPRWRVRPPAGAEHTSKYCALMGARFRFADLNSDRQFLAGIQAANPAFVFDRVYNRMTFVLPADQMWRAPHDFSLNELQLAIVRRDMTLLNSSPEISSQKASSGILSGGADNTGKSHFAGAPPLHKGGYTAPVIDRMYRSGELLLSFLIKQRYLDGNTRRSYVRSDLVCSLKSGDTMCLDVDLPVLDAGVTKQPTLYPTDVVCVTIIAIH